VYKKIEIEIISKLFPTRIANRNQRKLYLRNKKFQIDSNRFQIKENQKRSICGKILSEMC